LFIKHVESRLIQGDCPEEFKKIAGNLIDLICASSPMLIVEQRILSAPASIMSIPAAEDQEDFVSMVMNTALKNG
jgi:histidine ammonia-lyase